MTPCSAEVRGRRQNWRRLPPALRVDKPELSHVGSVAFLGEDVCVPKVVRLSDGPGAGDEVLQIRRRVVRDEQESADQRQHALGEGACDVRPRRQHVTEVDAFLVETV